MTADFDYDIAVIGAGPAGAATARRLAQAGGSVVLIERSRFDAPRVGESLAPGVQPLLAELGVWPQFLALQPLTSYGTRSVWGAAQPETHSHLLTPYLHGWHVDRLGFDRMLATAAEAAGVQLRLGRRVLRFEPAPAGGGTLHIACTEEPQRIERLRARFVVDASGRSAALARWVGARYAVFDRLVGVAARLDDHDAAAHCYTLVETTPDGWWYSAPVSATQSVLMLMTDGDLARTGRLDSADAWRAALRRAGLSAARVGGGSMGSMLWGPTVFPALSQRLVRGPGPGLRGWLSVGDAALAVDPVSGSGVLRALRTAADAAPTVLAALQGDDAALARYEAARDAECTRYLSEWASYYLAEPRWRDAPFWSRRAGGAAAPVRLKPAAAPPPRAPQPAFARRPEPAPGLPR